MKDIKEDKWKTNAFSKSYKEKMAKNKGKVHFRTSDTPAHDKALTGASKGRAMKHVKSVESLRKRKTHEILK